jgi:hypothetical protein
VKQGQIIPKGERKWLIRVFLGRDGTGKRHYLSEQIEGTYAAACKKRTAMLAEVQKQGHIKPNRQTVEQFYPDWLASKKKVSAYTRSQYEARYAQVKPGDRVTRMLGHFLAMTLTVESVTDTRITCLGGWSFDRATGAEVDEALGWGPERTGSYLIPPGGAAPLAHVPLG